MLFRGATRYSRVKASVTGVTGVISALAATQVLALPASNLIQAPLVPTGTAFSYYTSSTTRTPGVAAWTTTPPEISSLARALGSDKAIAGQITASQYAQIVYDYVRNNIAVEFRFGVGKGGRGALIDQSGTPADQAELMVKLLRAGNVTASYKVGTVTMTASQFGLWTGLVKGLNVAAQTFTVDARSACQFLADGGIPADFAGSTTCSSVTGNLSTITFGHFWVSAASKLYDPSFKAHALANGIDIPAAMGCGTAASPTCGTTMTSTSGGTLGTASDGAQTLSGVNNPALMTWLTARATSVQTQITTQNRLAYAQDIVGGKRLVNTTVTAGSSLPYTVASTALTSSTAKPDLPDVYRTKFRVRFRSYNQVFDNGLGVDITFFADEIAGRIIQLSAEDQIFMDTAAVPFSSYAACSSCTSPIVMLDVDHPYVASSNTYADEHADVQMISQGDGVYTPTRGLFPATVILGLGSEGPGTEKHTADLVSRSTQHWREAYIVNGCLDCTPNDTAVTIDFESTDQPLIGARYLDQGSTADQLVAGIGQAGITRHHDFGLVYADAGNPSLESGSPSTLTWMHVQSALSVNLNAPSGNATTDANNRQAVFETSTATWGMLEGIVATQSQWADMGTSTASLFAATAQSGSFRLLTPAQLATNGGTVAWGNAGYSEIQPGLLWNGASSAHTIYGNLKGGANLTADPFSRALETVRLDQAAAAHKQYLTVSAADGTATYTQTDLVSGTGDFPIALPFTRTYRSDASAFETVTTSTNVTQHLQGAGGSTVTSFSTRYSGPDASSTSRLGGGWNHNYNVLATLTGNGNKGLGYDAAIEASAAITTLYAYMDAVRNATFASRVSAELAQAWLATQLIYNCVVVDKGGAAESFMRLPDGTFFTSSAKASLVQSGQVSVLRDFKAVTFLYTGAQGDTIDFDVASYSRHPYPNPNLNTTKIGMPIFKANNWRFPDGTVVTFNYTAAYMASGWTQPIPSTCFDFVCYAQLPPTSEPYGYRLDSVTNNYGRAIHFVYSGWGLPVPSSPSGGTFTSVSSSAVVLAGVYDENNRSVGFQSNGCPVFQWSDASSGVAQPRSLNALYTCTNLTATEPDTSAFHYTYDPGTDSPDPPVFLANNYRLRRMYTPAQPGNPYRTLTYDGLFHVTSSTDRMGRTTIYRAASTYGSENWKRGEVDMPLGDAWLTIFNRRNSAVSSIDPLNNTTTMTYDNAERLLTKTYPESNTETNVYDVRSNLLSTTRHAKPSSTLADIVTSTTYGEGATVFPCTNPKICNKAVLETDARNYVQRNTWDPASGLLTRIEYGLNTSLTCALAVAPCPQVDMIYTPFATSNGSVRLPTQRTERVSASQNLVTAFGYNASNRLVPQSMTTDSGGLNLTTTFTFDAVGNLTQVDSPRSDVVDVRNFVWDSMRQLKMVIDSDPDATGPLPRRAVRNNYNSDGFISSTDLGTTTSPTGADFGAAQTTTYLRDLEGNVGTEVRPEQVLQYSFDADNRPLCTVIRMNPAVFGSLPGDACVLTTAGSFGQDRITRRVYDGAGRLQIEQRGYLTPQQEDYSTFAYTANGKVDWEEDANANRSKFTYDGFDRLSKLAFPSATTAHTSNTNDNEQYGYDPNGNRTSLIGRGTGTASARTIAYTFDPLNRETLKDLPGGTSTDVYSGYDLLGHPTYVHFVSAAGSGVDYAYDTALRLHTESTFGRTLTYDWDGDGNRIRVTYPDTNYIQYTFDAANRMSQVRENGATTGVGVLATYTYDGLGRRGTITRGNGVTTTLAFQTGTNLLGSLGFTGTTQNLNLTFGYNPGTQIRTRTWSNELYRFTPAAQNTAYVPDGLNRYSGVGNATFAYDVRGNLQSDGARTFSYDMENRLLSVSGTASITVSYDPLGRLRQDVAGSATTQFLYDGDRLTAEYDGSSNLLRRYVHGANVDEPILWYEGSGLTNRRWLLADQQGSVVAHSDASGIATTYAYGPNGEPAGDNWTGSRFRFTGQIALNDAAGLRLYHYKARVYDPYLGRFLQTDPVGYKDDVNLYSYTYNDPVNHADPAGTELIESAQEARKKYGKGTSGRGHHFVPFGSTTGKDMNISTEAREVFGQAVSGEPLPSDYHEGNAVHNKYTAAVKDELKKFAKETKIDLAKMTKTEAEVFVAHMQASSTPAIKAINAPVLRYTETVRNLAGGAGARWFYRVFTSLGIVEEAKQTLSTNSAACQANPDCNSEVRGE